MSSAVRAGGRSRFAPLLAGVLLLGIADSMIGPYLVLFGADEAGLPPFQVGVFMSLIAVSGLAVSTWLGRRYDRSASRWPAFVAVAGPTAGYLALTTTTSYALLALIAVGLLGAGMAAFPQLFTSPAPTSTTWAVPSPSAARRHCARCGPWRGPSGR